MRKKAKTSNIIFWIYLIFIYLFFVILLVIQVAKFELTHKRLTINRPDPGKYETIRGLPPIDTIVVKAMSNMNILYSDTTLLAYNDSVQYRVSGGKLFIAGGSNAAFYTSKPSLVIKVEKNQNLNFTIFRLYSLKMILDTNSQAALSGVSLDTLSLWATKSNLLLSTFKIKVVKLRLRSSKFTMTSFSRIENLEGYADSLSTVSIGTKVQNYEIYGGGNLYIKGNKI